MKPPREQDVTVPMDTASPSHAWPAAQAEAFRSAMLGEPLAATLRILAYACDAIAGDGRRSAFYVMADGRLEGIADRGDEAAAIGPPDDPVPDGEAWVRLAQARGFADCRTVPIAGPDGEPLGALAQFIPHDLGAGTHGIDLTAVADTAALIIARGREDRAHARTGDALREAETRQAFLLELSDALRPLEDGAAIERTAVRLLGERLGADRVFYASIDPDAEHWSFRQDYARVGASVPGRFPFSAYQRRRLPQWREGRMSSVADSETDPGLDADDRAGYAAFDARAAIGVPLVKHGRFAALLVVNQATPRRWTETELAMTREAAERTWAAMERARAEAALRDSEARYQALFASSPMPFLVLAPDAPDYTIAGANDAYLATAGMTRERLVGRRLFELFTDDPGRPGPLGPALLARSLGRVLAERRPDTLERLRFDVALPGGGFEPRWWRAISAPLPGADGTVVAIIHQVTDVTRLHVAEVAAEALQARQAFLLRLDDAMRAAVGADAIIATAARLLSEELHASRIDYAEIDDAAGSVQMHPGWTGGGTVPHSSELWSADTGRAMPDDLPGGRAVRSDDGGEPPHAQRDPPTPAINGTEAGLSVPLLVGGRAVAALSVHRHPPDGWTNDEVSLTRAVGERLWTAIERARAGAALRESEQRFRTLAEVIEDVFYVTDLDRGRLDYVSPAYRRIWGRPEAELIADPARFIDSIHPDDRGEVARGQAAQARGEAVRSEYRIVRPDGEVRWVLDRCFPIPDTRRRVSVGVASDITARKALEAERRAIEDQQRLLIELVPALLWWADPNAEAIPAGRRWRDYTGLDGDLDHDWFDAVHPDDRDAARAAFARGFAIGEPIERQLRILKAGDGHRWHLARQVPVRGGDGAIARWFGAAIDIHDIHELQHEQRMLVAELQHRVRNILTVTRLTFARTFEQGDDMNEMASHFRGRLDAMARTQVVLSRTARRSAQLEDLVRDELLSVGATEETGVTIAGPEVALDAKLAEALGMALHELTTNALKFGALRTPGGRLDVRWVLHIGEGGGRTLDLVWQEEGVSAVSVRPSREGFGRELIEEALPYRIRARTALEFRGGGVRCSISVPLTDESVETVAKEEGR